jgi:hypothetical protein
MNRSLLLKLHRWTTLVFAAPLLVVIMTELVLSSQPIVQQTSIQPGSLTADRLDGLLTQFDPGGDARALTINRFEQRMSGRDADSAGARSARLVR